MSTKYKPIPPFIGFGEIPKYVNPRMTVEEYRYYERKFFGFLEDKPVETPSRFQRFKWFTGISKITKTEDKVPTIKYDIQSANSSTFEGATDNNVDCLINSGKTTPRSITKLVVKTEDTATKTEGVASCDQEVQTVKPQRQVLKYFRRFFRSCKCFRTEE